MLININNIKKTITSTLLGLTLIFSEVLYANAQLINNNCIDTAIGCVPINDSSSLAGWLLGWAIGIGGGIAFLLIAYASFMVMTSQGTPDRLKAGNELLTSAISGLIMLIFSVFILKFIGIDIFKIPEFGFVG